MWPWQLKNVHKRSLLWAKLVAVSCSAHIILLFLLLFVYVDSTRNLTFTIDSRLLGQDLSVLLMESYKRPRVQKKGGQKVAFNGVVTGHSKKKSGVAKKTGVQKVEKKTTAIQKKVAQKPVQKSANTSVREAGKKQVKVSQEVKSVKSSVPVAKKPAVQTSVVGAKKEVQSQKKASMQKKIEIHKKVVVADQKKDSLQKSMKKNEPSKKKTEKVAAHKPNIQKKTPSKASNKTVEKAVKSANLKQEKEIVHPKVAQKNDKSVQKLSEKNKSKSGALPDTKSLAAQAALTEQSLKSQSQALEAGLTKSILPGVLAATNAVADMVESEEISIAIDGQEYDTESLLRYAALQQEFARCWQPPIGVGESCACDIKVYVAKDGSIADMQMVTSSGVLMYDVAARAALSAMKLPKWTRNKHMTITFK